MSRGEAVVFVSGGLASWATAKLASQKYDHITYLFNDVLIEDADTYRFLLEGMANVLGVPTPHDLLARCLALPDVSSDHNVRVRMWQLGEIRAEAMRRLPGLIWQADGRTPHMVWAAERFIGNSRTAHCSIVLKARVGDAWVARNAPDAVCEYGMYWDELARIEKLDAVKPRPVGRSLYESGLTHGDITEWLWTLGIKPPRQYGQGFTHANCSGLCCRAGKRHWAHKFHQNPAEARYAAQKEGELLAALPAALPMLTDRKGDGKKKPLPLSVFFAELEAMPMLISTLDDLGSGCGCVFDAMVLPTPEVQP